MCAAVNIARKHDTDVHICQHCEVTKAGYHHGDLRNALIEAGLRLSSESGPAAVGIRAAARAAGVTPTAAYRHFPDAAALLAAVRRRAFESLAAAVSAEVETVPSGAPGDRLEAIGRAYVAFALAKPGWYRTAFGPGAGSLEDARAHGTAFTLLGDVLDALVAARELPPDRRPMADLAAWSAVHGLATLLLDGPLAALPPAAVDATIARTLAMVRAGL
jgi:AcrR family transcriptional regulator